MMTWMPRRVVTGHDERGKSVFLHDGEPPVASTAPDGAGFFEIWSTSGAPAPVAATEPDPAAGPVVVPPPANGTKIRFNSFPPGTVSPVHRTQSVDYGIVIDGEVVLVLDDSETTLKAGDIAIQRGTSHRWENRTESVSRMVFVLVDGQFAEGLLATLDDGVLSSLLHDPGTA